MDDLLLSYYNRELAYIRKLGAEFAERHPKIAGRLRLDKDAVEDPHVSRLIESFAFLTARVRHTIDDSFPELTEALMGVLFPDYQAPVPSMSIAQIGVVPSQPQSRMVPQGTMLSTEPSAVAGRCYYRTCYDVNALPIVVKSASFRSQPYKAPALPAALNPRGSNSNQAVLCLTLKSAPGTVLSELTAPSLRFFINGQPQLTFKLYEFLLRHAKAVAIANDPKDPAAHFLPASALKPCGLDEREAMIPYEGRTSTAHRLLVEYFCFPEKFLFVELDGVGEYWRHYNDSVNLYIYFDQTHSELVQGISENTLALGCTPIVNLFEERLESITAKDIGVETKLCVNRTHAYFADVHTLKRIYARNIDGKEVELQPFYGAHHQKGSNTDKPVYWHMRRETSQWYGGRISHGTDSYLSLVDDDFKVTAPDAQWVIGGDALCTNRDLPDKLPFGPDEPKMHFLQGGAGLRTKCLLAPTSTIQPRLDDATRWQLVTQLSLQHFTAQDGLEVLKETLKLYDFKRIPENQAIIDGITDLQAELTTARLMIDGRSAICQGVRLTLECDEHYYSGSGLYLFTAILSEFFAQYCTLNSFVQLRVKTKQAPGSMITWPSRSGKQMLL
ncbi:MAG: type VI secretion system baseplate subunit TssF [Gammaproteobacteria bacterium]|nr:type VI secretion system baseplate subunit TssF [Gammaproteobacteria bacterium]